MIFHFVRFWSTRRVVWSRDLIQFSRINDGKVEIVDAIPMREIESVRAMQDNAYIKTTDAIMRRPAPVTSQVTNKEEKVFQIKTTADGYNSGRIYYLRVLDHNEELCGSIIQNLNKSSQAARKRMEVISQFERIQRNLNKFHDSAAFQTLVGVLIFVV